MIKHLACIMDGNRRWARERGMPAWEGHRQGGKAIERVIGFCLTKKIPYLSLYTLSLDNLNRSARELNFLFSLIAQEVDALLDFSLKHGVRVTVVGDRAQFPASVAPCFDKLERETACGAALQVSILFCYGGRQEIRAGVEKIALKIKNGELEPHEITEELVEENLWVGAVPDPDLIVRTGGQHRLSGFLLYKAAYAELYFSDRFWPAVTEDDLEKAVNYFYSCKRNFGA